MTGELPRLTAEEARVIGALVEKAMTTPDHYPMSLNAVVVACNQVSNRDPVVAYREVEVELVLRGLTDRGLAKMVHRPGDRVVKYRHALDDAVDVDAGSLALLAVLLLRGPQTPGELRQRTARYVDFTSLAELETRLDGLCGAGLTRRLERRPGQKEHRFVELLGPRPVPADDAERVEPERVSESDPDAAPPSDAAALFAEIAALRVEVAELRGRFEALLAELGVDEVGRPPGGEEPVPSPPEDP